LLISVKERPEHEEEYKRFKDGLGNKMVEQACLLFPHISDKIDTTIVGE
jgi:hypothetical protein